MTTAELLELLDYVVRLSFEDFMKLSPEERKELFKLMSINNMKEHDYESSTIH